MQPSDKWDDGDDVAVHAVSKYQSDTCGMFKYDADKNDAKCDRCGEWLGKNELYEIARVNDDD